MSYQNSMKTNCQTVSIKFRLSIFTSDILMGKSHFIWLSKTALIKSLLGAVEQFSKNAIKVGTLWLHTSTRSRHWGSMHCFVVSSWVF